MKRRTFSLSTRHDLILTDLSFKLDISLTEVIQRSLEALQEKEVKREKEVKG